MPNVSRLQVQCYYHHYYRAYIFTIFFNHDSDKTFTLYTRGITGHLIWKHIMYMFLFFTGIYTVYVFLTYPRHLKKYVIKTGRKHSNCIMDFFPLGCHLWCEHFVANLGLFFYKSQAFNFRKHKLNSGRSNHSKISFKRSLPYFKKVASFSRFDMFSLQVQKHDYLIICWVAAPVLRPLHWVAS